MQFSEFPFLRYVCFFILGILAYPMIDFIEGKVILSLLFLNYTLYLLLILHNLRRKKYLFPVALPVLAYSMLVLSGIYVAKEQHWQNERGLRELGSGLKGYMAMVLDHDEEKPRSKANRLMVLGGYDGENYQPSKAEVLVYHDSDLTMHPGDLIWVAGMPQLVPPPANPAVFDYRNFLLRQGITHRHSIGNRYFQMGQAELITLSGFFVNIRSGIIDKMHAAFSDSRALQVAQALLIGQKKNLDKEVSDAYVTAGAMHVLAVSGLHVGIIYGFFFLFVKPFRLPTRTRVAYLTVIILLIWCYACLTGLSPSVMRAATMFSFMAMAQMKSRNSSIFNAVALSALVLLLYDPQLLFAVGFQLSYGALLGILLFQPLLVRLWYPKHKLIEYIWQISTVGIAAQLATFPISAHYFNVFPTYFLLSNIVAIPGAFGVMSLGIPYMLLTEVRWIGDSLGWATQKVIQLINTLVFAIQDLPFSRLKNIYFSPLEILLYFILLGMVYTICVHPDRIKLKLLVGYLFGLALFANWGLFFRNQHEMIVYVDDIGVAMDFRKNGYCFFWDSMPEQSVTFQADPYRLQQSDVKVYPIQVLGLDNTLLLPIPVSSFVVYEKDSLHFGGNLTVKHAWQWSESGWEPYKSQKEGSFKINGRGLKFDLK
jgi:competence protein ComEC